MQNGDKEDCKISVVIPTYNRVNELRKCLNCIVCQKISYAFEIVVIDDGSFDETINYLEYIRNNISIPLRYFRQKNAGPGMARNIGIEEANGEFVAFIDDDCVPTTNWLESLITSLPDDIKCAGIGGRVVRCRNLVISRYIDDIGVMEHPIQNGKVQYLVTANALFRLSCLKEIGGFDNRIYWPGGEDPDLSFRLKEKGYYLTTTPLAVVKHRHRDTVKGMFMMFYNHGRGKKALVQFGKVKKDNSWKFLLNQYINSPIRYWKRKDLKILQRILFCILRWIHYSGTHAGYLLGPNFEDAKKEK